MLKLTKRTSNVRYLPIPQPIHDVCSQLVKGVNSAQRHKR